MLHKNMHKMLQLSEIKRENDVNEDEQKPSTEFPTNSKWLQPEPPRKMAKRVTGINKKSIRPINKDVLSVDERPPPTIVRTADNIEWTFLETFPDYDQMLTFVRENHCLSRVFDEKMSRIKYVCSRKNSNNCKLALLAFKDQKRGGYNVYKNGEHEHMDTDNNNSRPIITGGHCHSCVWFPFPFPCPLSNPTDFVADQIVNVHVFVLPDPNLVGPIGQNHWPPHNYCRRLFLF